ncbi:hypothetical protein Kisp01_30440 [Kineosporia sp. NBRC 101677]|uniref:TIGR03086 family metal-binding protein n=1 Tax=Kineosporia sp. NBRC 101677 TaxID=3032197 RepID=UPI0024A0A046|nr:TIGR03086 family metal-binding protein [Kineosporia sp. NBRC 101677]GLY16029.1 hypothetical protein Kisp01_30440 [Kineosporia sp. NBRC 101677]
MFDFTPATEEATRLLSGVRDEQLGAATPCEKWPVVQVLDHLMGLSLAFAAGARKTPLPMPDGPAEPSAHLPPNWREEAPRRLADLAAAWADPAAWQGAAEVGGVEMPAEVCALVALDEVVVHSWDLAVATGQAISVHPELAARLHEFWSSQEGDEGDLPLRQVIFGPVVEMPGEASVLERTLALTGRDPQWRPGLRP